MHIYREKAGVISEKPIWVCMCGAYLYTGETLRRLIEVLNTEWEHDKHLVG